MTLRAGSLPRPPSPGAVMDKQESLEDISSQLDGLARLLGTTTDHIPPDVVQGIALILGSLAVQTRKAAAA